MDTRGQRWQERMPNRLAFCKSQGRHKRPLATTPRRPAQVGARLLRDFQRFHPLVSARLSVARHPIGAGAFAIFDAAAAASTLAVLHGAGSGVFTSARRTVPLVLMAVRIRVNLAPRKILA
jgi:hypothetical protein